MENVQNQLVIPGLPDELGLHILARAPRSCHHVMKLVSKPWNSTMNADRIFTLRRLLGVTEEWLYFLFLNIQDGQSFCASLDPRGTWRRLPPIPPTLTTNNYLVLTIEELDGCLYVVGGTRGFLNAPATSSVWRYSPRTNNWTAVAPMSTARILCKTGVVSGLLYAVGGSRESHRSTAEVYSPATGGWTPIAGMTFPGFNVPPAGGMRPPPRPQALSAVSLAGRLWVTQGVPVFGGAAQRGGGEVYDPVTGAWGVMPRGMQREPLVAYEVLGGGRLLTLSREGDAAGAVIVKEYDVEQDRWRVVARLTEFCEEDEEAANLRLCQVCGWNGELLVVKIIDSEEQLEMDEEEYEDEEDKTVVTTVVKRADFARGELREVARQSFGSARMMLCKAVGV